jgi:isopenicillin N synthase-like dioxygenase
VPTLEVRKELRTLEVRKELRPGVREWDVDYVPVIAIDRLDSDADARSAIDRACREWGFFQIVGHGLPTDVIGALRREMHAFFSQTSAAKREISRTAGNPWGFFDRELTKNTPDWKEIYDYGPPGSTSDMPGLSPQWPSTLPGFEAAIRTYYQACEGIAFSLLEAVATNLGATPSSLRREFAPSHTSFLRLNYYPTCPAPARPAGIEVPDDGHLGINHHTDAGAVTLLLQDEQAGLQVFHDGAWHTVAPIDDALVVNIGDIVQVWSNDQYHAALHRVLANEHRERYSAPLFFNPSYETEYTPLASTVDAAHPARYRPIPWAEFRAQRAAGDYADYGPEVQIADYRVQDG